MWIKLAGGAILGFIAGHFVAPGYSFWVVIGVIAGYLLELGMTRDRAKKAIKRNASRPD
ncbi:MAG: hypothetical protein GX335_05065 [Firmicutes bacterium]|nr:hypothetical protein [Bacillota bacterium]